MTNLYIASELICVGERKGNLNGINFSKSLEGLPIVGFRYAVDILIKDKIKADTHPVVIIEHKNTKKEAFISGLTSLIPEADDYNIWLQVEMLKDFCRVAGIDCVEADDLDALDIMHIYAHFALTTCKPLILNTDLKVAPLCVIGGAICIQPLSLDKCWVDRENFQYAAFEHPVMYNLSGCSLILSGGVYGLEPYTVASNPDIKKDICNFVIEKNSQKELTSESEYVLWMIKELLAMKKLTSQEAVTLVRRARVILPEKRSPEVLKFLSTGEKIVDAKMLAHILVTLSLERYITVLRLSIGVPSINSNWHPFIKWINTFKSGVRAVDKGFTADTTFFQTQGQYETEQIGGF